MGVSALVLLALGAGVAQAGWDPEVVPVPGAVSAVSAADLDGDGLEDLVYSGPDGWGTAHQTAVGWRVEALGHSSTGLVETGDLDGDGDIDLFLEGPGANHPLQYRLQNDAGVLVNVVTTTWYSGVYEVFSMDLLDADGDGDVEPIYAMARNFSGAPLYVAFWDYGSDEWSSSYALFDDPVSECGLTADTAVGDVDGDGDVDALLAYSHDPACSGSYEHHAMWFENTGSVLNWPSHALSVDGDSAVQVSEISAVDLTLDGVLDIALAWSAADDASVDGTGSLALLPGLGGGSFGPSTSAKAGPDQTDAWLWTDVDGDADLDLVVAAQSDGRAGVLWAPNQAGGHSGRVGAVTEGAAHALCEVDVDADGTVALAVASDGGVTVYMADGL